MQHETRELFERGLHSHQCGSLYIPQHRSTAVIASCASKLGLHWMLHRVHIRLNLIMYSDL